jgi:YfiH family protein
MTETMIHAAAFKSLPEVRHAFFSRNGGVSEGLYETNNCAFGSSDNAVRVAENRAACTSRLGMSTLATTQQEHTSKVIEVQGAWDTEAAPVADALVTREQGVALGILTADCAPVLLADGAAGVVAAAHAGWKGACGGILENTVEMMVKLSAKPERIAAVVGPCIAQISYEVGPEFAARFQEINSDFAHYFRNTKADGHTHFDLAKFAADRLRECGVRQVAIQGDDTCKNERQYFSYRRSILRGEPDYGRQLSAIGLAEK